MRHVINWIAAASLCVVAVPAVARSWVTLDVVQGEGGQWVDRDTIRREGNVVYFEVSPYLASGDYPGEATPGRARAYDCRTKRLWYLDGEPELSVLLSAVPYDYVLCGILPPT